MSQQYDLERFLRARETAARGIECLRQKEIQSAYSLFTEALEILHLERTIIGTAECESISTTGSPEHEEGRSSENISSNEDSSPRLPLESEFLVRLLSNRARCCFHLGHFSECIADASEALSIDPGRAMAAKMKTLAHESMGGYCDLAQAQRTLQEFVQGLGKRLTVREVASWIISPVGTPFSKIRLRLRRAMCKLTSRFQSAASSGWDSDRFDYMYFLNQMNLAEMEKFYRSLEKEKLNPGILPVISSFASFQTAVEGLQSVRWCVVQKLEIDSVLSDVSFARACLPSSLCRRILALKQFCDSKFPDLLSVVFSLLSDLGQLRDSVNCQADKMEKFALLVQRECTSWNCDKFLYSSRFLREPDFDFDENDRDSLDDYRQDLDPLERLFLRRRIELINHPVLLPTLRKAVISLANCLEHGLDVERVLSTDRWKELQTQSEFEGLGCLWELFPPPSHADYSFPLLMKELNAAIDEQGCRTRTRYLSRGQRDGVSVAVTMMDTELLHLAMGPFRRETAENEAESHSEEEAFPLFVDDRHRCHLCETWARKKCSVCRSVYYCSSRCQRRDWRNHKQFCRGEQ